MNEITASNGTKMIITASMSYEQAMDMMREYSENGLSFSLAFCRDDGSISIHPTVRMGGQKQMHPAKRAHLGGGKMLKRLFKSDGKIPLCDVDSDRFFTPFRWGLMAINGQRIV
jgi:hypothetical protein